MLRQIARNILPVERFLAYCDENYYKDVVFCQNVQPKALSTRSVKSFDRQAYFCLFKQNFERKSFPECNKKFPA